jgi:hypothetical protein
MEPILSLAKIFSQNLRTSSARPSITAFCPPGLALLENKKCNKSLRHRHFQNDLVRSSDRNVIYCVCVERRMQSMNATIMTVARLAAIKAVKRNIHAQGGSPLTSNGGSSSRLPTPIYATIRADRGGGRDCSQSPTATQARRTRRTHSQCRSLCKSFGLC